MKTPEQLASSAVDTVTKVLRNRLKNAGLSTTRPDFYFHCEVGSARPFPGGQEVRVKTWRHWSHARVEFDANTGTLMTWAMDALCDPPNEKELTLEEALDVAAGSIEIPPGAEKDAFYHYDYAVGRKVAHLQWRHVHQGLRVDGDYLWVVIHPQTKRIIEWACKWRQVRLPRALRL